MKLPTIFVSIASYRDPDCQNTVAELFEMADHPKRIFVGICWQFVPGEDDDCFKSVLAYPAQVRRIDIHASESMGACWARHQVQTLWQGEDYYFQIDSHMRFVKGWDTRLIKMLAKCPSKKAVLSTYPLAFTPPRELEPEALVTIHPKGFNSHGILAQRSTVSALNEAPKIPEPTAFVAGGLLFGPGSIVREVPYDPYVYFEGEEISLAVRLWTHGWDIFTPNAAVAFHDYGQRPERPRHWKDKVNWAELNEKSRIRLNHLLGAQPTQDPSALIEIEQYGLGSVRTLEAYEAFSGLDFKGGLYRGNPLLLEENSAEKPEQAEKRKSIFNQIWQKNLWGNPETRSGDGSSISATGYLRSELPRMFEYLGIQRLADVGCGDLNWMESLTANLQFYAGYDIVAGLVGELQSRYGERPNCFFKQLDIVTSIPVICDAVLCRDCLTHFPLDAAVKAIENLKRSGARYLIATTHDAGRNSNVSIGGWHTMNLMAPPFNFPQPRLMIKEGGAKGLGVWLMSDLPSKL